MAPGRRRSGHRGGPRDRSRGPELHADVMLILTDVAGIYRDYGNPEQGLLMRRQSKSFGR